MKKIFALLCCFFLLAAMTACEKEEIPVTQTPTVESTKAVTESTLLPTQTEATEESTVAEFPLVAGQSVCKTYRDESGTICAMAIVPVTNEGSDALLLPSGTLEFQNGNGKVVFLAEYVSAFPSIIAPGETAYYFEQVNPELADTEELTVTLSTDSPQSGSVTRYDVSETYLRSSPYGGLILTGRVTNATDRDCDMLCVAAILYDENGAPLAVIYNSLIDPLAAGTTMDFTVEGYDLPGELTAEAVADMEIFAYPVYVFN